jgi:hypothetical protein
MLRRIYVLFFIELSTRRVHLAGLNENPDGGWTTQQARNRLFSLPERDRPLEFLVRDNDGKFTRAFDTVFNSEGIRVIHTPARAPRPTRSPSDSSAPSDASATTGSWSPTARTYTTFYVSSSTTTTATGRTGRSASHPPNPRIRRQQRQARQPLRSAGTTGLAASSTSTRSPRKTTPDRINAHHSCKAPTWARGEPPAFAPARVFVPNQPGDPESAESRLPPRSQGDV